MTEHGPEDRNAGTTQASERTPVEGTTVIRVRVNYSETDQMGIVYHGRYAVWLDIARTEHLRRSGLSYRELEAVGLRLVVGQLEVSYRQPARYDDLIRIRCWVRARASRKITFGYHVEHDLSGSLLATAETALMVLDGSFRPTRLPPEIAGLLPECPDPTPLRRDAL